MSAFRISDFRTAAFEYLSKVHPAPVRAGLILGTGLGGLVHEIEVHEQIPYADIPHFPFSTVEGHKGRLIFGTIGEVPVVVMQGRFHLYEGYSAREIAHPIRVMKMLGIERLFISNVSGSVNPNISKGTLVALEDHINLQGVNPLTGANDDELGPRYPDMSEPYSHALLTEAASIANELGIPLAKGVYAGVLGPNLETRAEYKMLRLLGADIVGMSTVPEVIAARHMSIPVFAISLVTDEGFPEDLHPVNIEDILAVAREHEPQLSKILRTLVARAG